jgi:hypothetical protein
MLTASLVAALMLQQAAGMISWNPPPAPDPNAPVEAAVSAPAVPAATIPEWGLADPFAWERSQCSPIIRKDSSMELCQARVRTDLAAALGDKLPAGLQPSGVEGCRQVSNGAGGYELTCAPVRRELTSSAAPRRRGLRGTAVRDRQRRGQFRTPLRARDGSRARKGRPDVQAGRLNAKTPPANGRRFR